MLQLFLFFGLLCHLLRQGWTSPKTWGTGELVTAADLNEQIRDNFNALKAPPTDHYEINEGANYSTSGTSFADVDATDLSLSITTTGGDVMIGFIGSASHDNSGGMIYFDVTMDGTRLAGDDGICGFIPPTTAPGAAVSFVYLETGVSAGAHTFNLQWKTSGATARLYAGAGTANADVHGQFWVREVS